MFPRKLPGNLCVHAARRIGLSSKDDGASFGRPLRILVSRDQGAYKTAIRPNSQESPEFDSTTKQLRVLDKFRGRGDCGLQATYSFFQRATRTDPLARQTELRWQGHFQSATV